jgi:hypothetical protein
MKMAALGADARSCGGQGADPGRRHCPASETFPRTRIVNDFTSRLRGNARLPPDGTGPSRHAADGARIAGIGDLSERGVLGPVREQGLLAEDFHAGSQGRQAACQDQEQPSWARRRSQKLAGRIPVIVHTRSLPAAATAGSAAVIVRRRAASGAGHVLAAPSQFCPAHTPRLRTGRRRSGRARADGMSAPVSGPLSPSPAVRHG